LNEYLMTVVTRTFGTLNISLKKIRLVESNKLRLKGNLR
jgi:hypothetical protein